MKLAVYTRLVDPPYHMVQNYRHFLHFCCFLTINDVVRDPDLLLNYSNTHLSSIIFLTTISPPQFSLYECDECIYAGISKLSRYFFFHFCIHLIRYWSCAAHWVLWRFRMVYFNATNIFSENGISNHTHFTVVMFNDVTTRTCSPHYQPLRVKSTGHRWFA